MLTLFVMPVSLLVSVVSGSSLLYKGGSVVTFDSALYVSSPMYYRHHNQDAKNCTVVVAPRAAQYPMESYPKFCKTSTFPLQFNPLMNNEFLVELMANVSESLLKLNSTLNEEFQVCIDRLAQFQSDEANTTMWLELFPLVLVLEQYCCCLPEEIAYAASYAGYYTILLQNEGYYVPGYDASIHWNSITLSPIPFYDIVDSRTSDSNSFMMNLESSSNPYQNLPFYAFAYSFSFCLATYKLAISILTSYTTFKNGGKPVIIVIAAIESLPSFFYIPFSVMGLYEVLANDSMVPYDFRIIVRLVAREAFFFSNFILAMFVRNTLTKLDQKSGKKDRIVNGVVIVLFILSRLLHWGVIVALNILNQFVVGTLRIFDDLDFLSETLFEILVAVFIIIQRSKLHSFMKNVQRRLIRTEPTEFMKDRATLLLVSSVFILLSNIVYSTLTIYNAFAPAVPIGLVISSRSLMFWMFSITGLLQLHSLLQPQAAKTSNAHQGDMNLSKPLIIGHQTDKESIHRSTMVKSSGMIQLHSSAVVRTGKSVADTGLSPKSPILGVGTKFLSKSMSAALGTQNFSLELSPNLLPSDQKTESEDTLLVNLEPSKSLSGVPLPSSTVNESQTQ
jgi:hypothetical protein